jgi:transposase
VSRDTTRRVSLEFSMSPSWAHMDYYHLRASPHRSSERRRTRTAIVRRRQKQRETASLITVAVADVVDYLAL